MDALSAEDQAKEQCRQVFYDALPGRMERAVAVLGGAGLIDLVSAGHSLLSVLFDRAPAKVDTVFMYPVRTYEILRELKNGTNPDSRERQAEAR